MIETIYIARHGFRMNWVSNNWTTFAMIKTLNAAQEERDGTRQDPPLARRRGSIPPWSNISHSEQAQAQELADYFLSLPEDQRPTAIFSSPYYRCLQTSQPVAKALGVPIFVEHGISEWYSPVAPNTGLHPRPGPASSLTPTSPKSTLPRGPRSGTPRARGDVAQVHARAAGFLDAHARVLLVSHAATTIALARALLGAPGLPMRVGCCSLTEVVRSECYPRVGGWEARRLADGGHLKEGASRDWGFEDIQIEDGKVRGGGGPGRTGTEHETDDLVGPQVSLTSNL
ncbi:histidine phosphatase superfamily [Mycena haematopus]|nr:histidine phosphatase superfamily [Mycena haematopus]